jgi:hypothetical protein
MNRIVTTSAAILACVALAPTAARAVTDAPMAWVSAKSGQDISTCGILSNPCRTFQYAHDYIVAAGGEIRVKDAGEYGPLTIGKSISIVNDGVGVAGISVGSGGTGIKVEVLPTDKVFIKGLTLVGENGLGLNGIEVIGGGNFTLTNCTIKGFASANSGTALRIFASFDLKFSISNTIISENYFGVYISTEPILPDVRGVLSRVEIANNSIAFFVQNFSKAVLSEVNIVSNSSNPVFNSATMYMTRSVLANSATSQLSSDTNTMLYSFGDNVVKGGDYGAGSITSVEPFK